MLAIFVTEYGICRSLQICRCGPEPLERMPHDAIPRSSVFPVVCACALAAQATACIDAEPAEDTDTSALTSPPVPSFNGPTCNQFGTIFSSGNVYYVMNNVFNDAANSQCITASGTGFTVTSANHDIATNGAPAAYTAA